MISPLVRVTKLVIGCFVECERFPLGGHCARLCFSRAGPDLSLNAHQNGVGQQPSHEHGAEATAPCDRQVMASDGVFT